MCMLQLCCSSQYKSQMDQPILKKVFTVLGIISTLYFLYQRYERSIQSNELKSISKLYYSGDLDSCEVLLLDFTERHPNNYGGWNFLGNVYLDDYRDSLAEPAYSKSLELEEDNVQALTGLGVVARVRKDYARAEEYYEKAIKVNPKFAQSYSSLVVVKLINKNYDEAVELGERAWELNSKELGIAGNLALAYHFKGFESKRDSLFNVLENRNYKDLSYLKMITSGLIKLEDVL